MPNETLEQGRFATLFRHEFRYVEQPVDLPPTSPLLTTFYEAVSNQSGRICGYWNVFLNFYAVWDLRDNWFALYLEPHANKSHPPVGQEGPTLLIDWVLDELNPAWRKQSPTIDKGDSAQLVRSYAAAIKPYARKIFIPAIRPSEGFEGFSWWPQVKQRMGTMTLSAP